VLMTLANSLFLVNTSQEPFTVEKDFAGTGNAPNRFLLHRGAAYVVNSLSNNLQRVQLDSRKSDLPFAVLPLASSPTDLAITCETEGDLAWVTLFKSHQLAIIELGTGQVRELLGGAIRSDGGASHEAGAQDSGSERPYVDGGDPVVVGVETVVQANYGTGAGFGQSSLPQIIQGGPQGSGENGSSSDVLSLGVKGELVVDFGPFDIVDGPGPDFIVFENAFLVAPFAPFSEPAIVGVSAEMDSAADFHEFPCDLSITQGQPETSSWPFPGCAGVQPVRANVKSNTISPLDPTTAGGDAFDLATLGIQRARYLRLRDAGLSLSGSSSQGFDLDAVVLLHYIKR
jgi:hypothetical protein